MRNINLDKVTISDLIDHEGISRAFKAYLTDILGYDEDEADFVVENDFENPYDTQYIFQDFEGNYVVDGKNYEVMLCHTDFSVMGMYHLCGLEPFEFYMYIDKEDLGDHTVGSYSKARKLYLV